MGGLYDFRAKKTQLDGLEIRFEALEEDYTILSKQISSNLNAADKNAVKRQLEGIGKEMIEVARECELLSREISIFNDGNISSLDESTETKDAIQFLNNCLSPHESEIETQIKNAYQFACPPDWPRKTPETLRGKLADLEDMPSGESGYSPLLKFVAHLVVNDLLREKHSSPCQDLQNWAEQRNQNFFEVLQYVRQSPVSSYVSSSQQQAHSYLMVVIERSRTVDQRKEPRYFVKSWFILEGQTYQTGTATGVEVLAAPGTSEEAENAITVDEIQELLKAFLEESRVKSLSQGRFLENLTVELFLPSDLLNHAIERWEDTTDEFSISESESIGFQYRLLVRSSDRLISNYLLKRGTSWKEKWNQVRQRMQERSPQNVGLNDFVSGDNSVSSKDLFCQLIQPQMIGLKLAQKPLSIGKDSAFAALQASGTPIAVWMRQPLTSVDCAGAIDELLRCCVHEIPERVKQQRREAFRGEPDCHIGHHLALLWEDFDRFPPGYDPYRTSA